MRREKRIDSTTGEYRMAFTLAPSRPSLSLAHILVK